MSSKVDKSIKKQTKKREPLWKGPESDEKYGGVTQSMLNAFLGCRERFRVRYIEGLQPEKGFNKSIEFGQMWHLCEESNERGDKWQDALIKYSRELCDKYPFDRDEISKWYNICKKVFPVYIEFWERRDKYARRKKKESILEEVVFEVPYSLPSGRIVHLKGKWDRVDITRISNKRCLSLTDHKTKGDIDEQKIVEQLAFDLQSMFYSVALDSGSARSKYQLGSTPLREFCYNVIKRPLSSGKGSIKQRKNETKAQFYNRLLEDYIEAEPERYFMRWDVRITQRDIERFRREFLDPILEQLCDWYTWITNSSPLRSPGDVDRFIVIKDKDGGERTIDNSIHWRTPFGIWNSLEKSGKTDLDEYLNSGNEVGLSRTETMFEELYEEEG